MGELTDGLATFKSVPVKNSTIVSSPFPYTFSRRSVQNLTYLRRVRDEYLHEVPILPGAVYTFVHVAASREWTITGQPRAASRAVDYLNNAKFYDAQGMLHYGWQEYITRRVLDWLVLGRTSFLSPLSAGRSRQVRGPLQYVDPTELIFAPDSAVSIDDLVITRDTKRRKPKIWDYRNNRFSDDEIFVNHIIPTGGSGHFVSPVLSLLPVARLAWLIREHDSARADGRKIRDIFMVADDNMVEAISQAITQSVALWNGEDPSKVGIPIVAVNRIGGNAGLFKIEDMFARLGLAEIPDSLDREKFTYDYVNQIAATIELGLRYFWYDPRGTNRSLEQVNEQRQTVKGPAYFIRSEQRHINGSGILGKAVMRFIEETDAQAQRDRAEILKTYAEATEKFSGVLGGVLDSENFLTWLQKQGVLPDDMDLSGLATYDESPVRAEDLGGKPDTAPREEREQAVRENPLNTRLTSGSGSAESGSPRNRDLATAKTLYGMMVQRLKNELESEQSIPDYGEVVLDMDGSVTEVRRKAFPVEKWFVTEELARVEVENGAMNDE